MSEFFVDTETCGLHGLAVLIQWAEDDGQIELHEAWRRPVRDTLQLIEWFMTGTCVGFNWVFDHFHLTKLYCIFKLLESEYGGDKVATELPEAELIELEERARFVDLCLRPPGVIDLMLHSFKGPYQSLMERNDIRVKKVPVQIANLVRTHLERTIHLDTIYFAGRDPDAPRWTILDHKVDGKAHPLWRDIKLSFRPSGSLKSLAKELLGAENAFKFADIAPARMPADKKLGYAPFAAAHSSGFWPGLLEEHVAFWQDDQEGRSYARRDVQWTRDLRRHDLFADATADDRDSLLAAHVASTRWRGFDVDIEALKRLRDKYVQQSKACPTAGKACYAWLEEEVGAIRMQVINELGTAKEVLTKLIREWPEESTKRMGTLLAARQAGKRVEMIDKLLKAGRWHPSYRIMGSLSNRMAGAGGMNPQGFPRQPEFRNCFTFTSDPNEDYQYGDFDSFEIAIAASAYNDPKLNSDLRGGKKFHGLFGAELFEMTYEEILADKDLYNTSKIAGLSNLYGGTWMTMVYNQGIEESIARGGEQRFLSLYTSVAEARKVATDMFCSMRQPDGRGTRVEWHEPAECIESLLGFRRYYTLENQIVKALFDISSNAPQQWCSFEMCPACQGEKTSSEEITCQERHMLSDPNNQPGNSWTKTADKPCYKCKGKGTIEAKVVRRDREQTMRGAAQSALLLAAFQLQGSNMRSAANHVIQSTGGEITKELQVRMAKLQPIGIHPYRVRTCNVHDEINGVFSRNCWNEPEKIVQGILDEYRGLIEFIGMTWVKGMACWKDSEVECPECNKIHGTKYSYCAEHVLT